MVYTEYPPPFKINNCRLITAREPGAEKTCTAETTGEHPVRVAVARRKLRSLRQSRQLGFTANKMRERLFNTKIHT